jgi:DNA-binding CsgD family transcriptional regulator
VLTSLQDVTALHAGDNGRASPSDRVLSPREHEVVELLAAGLTGEQVAVRLGISPATVRVHIRNATAKLGASTRTQAVAIAVARGEVAAPEASRLP